jgi:hypothetical protein
VPSTLVAPTQSGLDQLSLTAWLCAAFAGLAVFLLLRHPAGQLRRMTRRKSKLAVVVAPMVRLFRGRADAPPLGRRLLLSMVGVLALGLAAARIDGWVACSGSRYR